MKQAQAAWALLSAVFVICGTVVIVNHDGYETTFAVTCLVIGIIGWILLTVMILLDRRP